MEAMIRLVTTIPVIAVELTVSAGGGILDKHRLGRENYYINRDLVDLLFDLPPLDLNVTTR